MPRWLRCIARDQLSNIENAKYDFSCVKELVIVLEENFSLKQLPLSLSLTLEELHVA